MRELIEYVVRQIVNNPDDVLLDEQSENEEVHFILKLNPEDIGIVIGKGGQTIKAIRKLIMIRSRIENTRVYLDISEPVSQAV